MADWRSNLGLCQSIVNHDWLTFLLERLCMNKNTVSCDIGCTKKGKEWAWIALYCQTSCRAIFSFFLLFFLLLLLLGRETGKCLINKLEKTRRNELYQLSCLSQLVGCITDAASTAFVLLPLINTPPPPPHTHTQFSHSQITEADISYQLQVHVANKIWLRDFVHKNNWKLCETF